MGIYLGSNFLVSAIIWTQNKKSQKQHVAAIFYIVVNF